MNHKNIKVLNLNENKLDDESMNNLADLMSSNQSIETLDVARNLISDTGLEMLGVSLFGNTTIKKLNISGNVAITNKSSIMLKEIASKTQLEKLGMKDLSISTMNKIQITFLLHVPNDARDIPIISKEKSAAKSSAYTKKVD